MVKWGRIQFISGGSERDTGEVVVMAMMMMMVMAVVMW